MRSKAVVLLAVLFASTSVVVGGDANKELKKFAGTWSVVSADKDGKPAPEGKIANARFTFKGDKLTIAEGGEVKDEVTIKIDPTKKPKQIDVMVRGKEHPGIYKFAGKQLTICVGEKERPTEFKSAEGSQAMLIVLKRAKN